MKDKTKVIDRIRARTKPENVQFIQKNLEISHQIAVRLEEKGWSQKELARQLGKQESEVSKILSGRHNITLNTITKIEAIFDEDIIVTPIEACKKYTSTEYITFYIPVYDNYADEIPEKYPQANIIFEENETQTIVAA